MSKWISDPKFSIEDPPRFTVDQTVCPDELNWLVKVLVEHENRILALQAEVDHLTKRLGKDPSSKSGRSLTSGNEPPEST